MAPRMLSPSAINTYLACPRKYFLRYIKKLKQKPSIYLLRGQAVHEGLARFNQEVKPTAAKREECLAAALEFFDEAWRKLEPALNSLGLPQATLVDFYRESAEMVSDWVDRQIKAAPYFPAVSQSELKIFCKKHQIMGIIDAVQVRNGRPILIDYKTSKRDDLTDDIQRQLGIYALVYQERFGKKPYLVAADFLKTGKERGFVVTDSLLSQMKRLIRDIHHKTQSQDIKDYPCTCGGWCQRDFILNHGGS